MFVSRSMTRKVITVDQEAGIFDAQQLLAKNNIRHLPIVDKDRRLIGIITDRDIRSALPYHALNEPCSEEEKERVSKYKVKDIMTKDPISISPTYTIQDALLLIQNSKVGALPVVDEDHKLTGIISVRDLLRAFINVLGIGENVDALNAPREFQVRAPVAVGKLEVVLHVGVGATVAALEKKKA